jgi:Ca2+-binding EF-hand superfamily protein
VINIMTTLGSSERMPFQDVFRSQDKGLKGYLTAEELSHLYTNIRREQLSVQQVVASIETVCAGDTCDPDEFLDCLKVNSVGILNVELKF